MSDDDSAATLLASIPFRHAGRKLETLTNLPVDVTTPEIDRGLKRVTVDGGEYHVANGYLVPYYPRTEDDISRRSEQWAQDRVKRFFKSAEPDIEVTWTREEIQAYKAAYLASTDNKDRAAKARLLTGAMVNRMGRLACAITQNNRDGFELEIKPADGEHFSPQQLGELKKEFDGYYKYFLVNVDEKNAVQYVRRNRTNPDGKDYQTDQDQYLSEVIRELGKALAITTYSEEEHLTGLLQKIGQAMEAIDQTERVVQRTLREIAHCFPEPKWEEYRQAVTTLAALCRARAGTRNQDHDSYSAIYEQMSITQAPLDELAQSIASRGVVSRIMGHSSVSEQMRALELMQEGIGLMIDMAEIRYPRNHYAFTKDQARSGSVELFEEKVAAWQKSLPRLDRVVGL